MDLEDWELLPNINNFKNLDLDQESGTETPKQNIETDDFIYPSQESLEKSDLYQELKVDPTTNLFQVPITWEPETITEETTTDQKQNPPQDPDFLEPDPDLLTGSAYNKFADMKLDTEEEKSTTLTRKDSDLKGGFEEEEDDLMKKKEIDWVKDEKLSLWKLGFNGIGAICSFGVAAAAASICVLFLGHNNNNNFRGCRNKNQILRFQIYSDDNKRMNEVVNRATKLNEAISVIKGLPVARAQISFGGYYDGI